MIKNISVLFIFILCSSQLSYGASKKKKRTKTKSRNSRIIYKYKKYEKFDFENLDIEGSTGNPGDLSVSPRYKVKFKNPLPYRKNFNTEIRKGVDRIR